MSDDADRRLGELAVQAGCFGPRDLARALREARAKGRPLAETLVEMKLLTSEQAHALGGGRLEAPPKPQLMAPLPRQTSRARRRLRVVWRRMSPHARVWLLVIALLVTLFALSIPLSLLRQ